MITLYQFAKESNEIESIHDKKRHKKHEQALKRFIFKTEKMTSGALEAFVYEIEPNHHLRVLPEDQVFIGGRACPEPSESLVMFHDLLGEINYKIMTPWKAHTEYEFIHPFTDGNGRSGRALWLWMMLREFNENSAFHERAAFRYPFLQWYYYQTLANYSENRDEK